MSSSFNTIRFALISLARTQGPLARSWTLLRKSGQRRPPLHLLRGVRVLCCCLRLSWFLSVANSRAKTCDILRACVKKTESDGRKTINEYIRDISAFIESLYSDVEKDRHTLLFRCCNSLKLSWFYSKPVLCYPTETCFDGNIDSNEEKQHEHVLIYFRIM